MENFYLKSRKNLINILLSKLGKRKMKILDVGTNDGRNIPVLKEYGEVYAIDLDKKNLPLSEFYNPKEVKVMDVTNLKYTKEKFDLICNFDILEHVDDKLAVENIKRVLKKEGHCFVTVPAFNFLFSSHDKALKHQRRYNPKELIKLFKEFKLIKIGFANFFLFPLIALVRLIRKNKTEKEETVFLSDSLNSLLFYILNFENKLIKLGFRFPFGLNIYAIFRK